MKTPVILGGLLLLAVLLPPAGHGARHSHHCLVHGYAPRPPVLLPPRIVRTPAVARQHRQVRAVRPPLQLVKPKPRLSS
jgi:hypothetical protein